MSIRSLALLGMMTMLAWAKPTHAETFDTCAGFITSVPVLITSPGTWCLSQNLSTANTSGNAINIQTNNVTIDCNNFKLDGLTAGLATQTRGIYALNRLNATVRRCHIRGFYYGINFVGSNGGGHAVEDNRLEGNTYAGMSVEGDGSVLQRNRVLDTGGSTTSADAIGIYTAYAVDVLDNSVSDVVARNAGNGSAYGIWTYNNPNGSISGNRVRGVLKNGTGLAYGIISPLASRITLRNNDLVSSVSASSTGMECGSVENNAKDNVVSGFFTGISVCSDAGGNFVNP